MYEELKTYRQDGNKEEIDLGRVVLRFENGQILGVFYRDHGEHHITEHTSELHELANKLYSQKDKFQRKGMWSHDNIAEILREGGKASPLSDYSEKAKNVMQYVNNHFNDLGLIN